MKGYTLIEILTALVIMGLLFGLGSANFRDFSRRQALVGVAKEIEGDLRLAQGYALSGQKPPDPDAECSVPDNTLDSYGFDVDREQSEYNIEANCTGSEYPIVVKSVNLPSDISFFLSNPPNPLNFKVLGQGTNIESGFTWELNLIQAGTGNMATVTVTSGGEIYSSAITPIPTPPPTLIWCYHILGNDRCQENQFKSCHGGWQEGHCP